MEEVVLPPPGEVATLPSTPVEAATAPVAPAPISPVRMDEEVGAIVLHVGVEAVNWGVEQIAAAAEFAHAHGVDTLCIKRADGSIKWYGTPAHLAEERQACLDHGVGFLPMLYSYGPKFGMGQVDGECAVLAELMAYNGSNHSACVDMEAEYDGRPDAASHFANLMRPVPGLLAVSTWANPISHSWPVRQLAPCVNAWVPQQYNNYLAAQEIQEVRDGETILFPTVDLTQEFGPNDPVTIAGAARAHGHKSLWIWEYEVAVNNPDLLARVIAAFKV